MKKKRKYIKINTGDSRFEAWGYLQGKTLELHIRIPALTHTIPIGSGNKIVCETAAFQVHDIKVKL